MKTCAILLCSGKSKRFGGDKLLTPLFGKSVFLHALETLNNNKLIGKIFITANKKNYSAIAKQAKTAAKLEKIILGGKTRRDSVKKAVFFIAKYCSPGAQKPDFLVIHNGANPFVTDEEITKCINFLKKNTACAGVGVGRKVSKTIKKIAKSSRIIETIDRGSLFETETPQVVRFEEFLKACGKPAAKLWNLRLLTDDLAVLESAGFKTHVLPASEKNKKITFSSDFPFEFRMGIGEDSHAFSRKHRGLWLGGVLFKKFPKLEADSDGDVILHAVATAISQAVGKGSLGIFAAPLFKKGIRDSRAYLKKILKNLKTEKMQIQNVGINIEAAKPKIDPLAPRIKKNLSKLLDIPQSQIGITAHSGEKLTEFGKGHGIHCSAVVTLVS